MKKLYVHIGTHKTGTTSIQNKLNECSYSLLKSNAFYISTTGIFNQISSLKSYDNRLTLKAREALIAGMQKFPDIDTFITSSEHLSGSAYCGYKNSALMARMLLDVVSGLNLKVYIVIYLRRQDKFIESLYGHMIESGYSVPKFEKFIDFNNEYYNWDLLLKSYEKYFNKKRIIVRNYDATLSDGGVLKDFCKCVNIPIIPSIRLNPGSSLGSIELQKICNSNLPQKDADKISRMIRRRNRMPEAIKSNKKYFFNNRGRDVFLKKYQQSNNNIFSRYKLERFPSMAVTKEDGVVDIQDVLIAMINTITQAEDVETRNISKKVKLLRARIKKMLHLVCYRVTNFKKNI